MPPPLLVGLLNFSQAYVLALKPIDTEPLLMSILRHGIAPRAIALRAVNSSEAMLMVEELPLYTRHQLRHGRNEHMQIGNYAMLGCLYSHINAWRLVGPGETVAIFEVRTFLRCAQRKPPPPPSHFAEPIQEDTQIDSTSEARMRLLEQDMAGIEWDIILLETGHANVRGKNPLLRLCFRKFTRFTHTVY